MLTCKGLFRVGRVDRLLKFSTSYVKSRPLDCFQGPCSYYSSRCESKVGRAKDKLGARDWNKKRKTSNLVWRSMSTQASINEECLVKDIAIESEDGSQNQELKCSISNNVSDAPVVMEVAELVNQEIDLTPSSSGLQDDIKDRTLERESEKHSLSIEIGASVFRFIKGKEGSTQKKIEREMGVKIIFPSSKKEDSIIIEGTSPDSVSRASERIHAIIDEAVKSPSLDYSHFVSLPLAIHPELVDKLVNFQNTILGVSDPCLCENGDSDSNEDTSDNEEKEQGADNKANVAVALKFGEDNEYFKVNMTSLPVVSYAPKASRSSTRSGRSQTDLGIDKSIFIKPKTFHLTVLMLKLWNMDRVNAANQVLKSVSSKVMDTLDNRPLFIRLKGLDCMRGSPEKACIIYAPVEEIGDGDRLLRACQVIIDAYNEAGLVLKRDYNKQLKLHATLMNIRHKKRKKGTRRVDYFDARGIFKQFGSEEWGEYLLPEAHLSQRFVFDESGYYNCCASIPLRQNMQVD